MQRRFFETSGASFMAPTWPRAPRFARFLAGSAPFSRQKEYRQRVPARKSRRRRCSFVRVAIECGCLGAFGNFFSTMSSQFAILLFHLLLEEDSLLSTNRRLAFGIFYSSIMTGWRCHRLNLSSFHPLALTEGCPHGLTLPGNVLTKHASHACVIVFLYSETTSL